jgi:hypothetical protein
VAGWPGSGTSILVDVDTSSPVDVPQVAARLAQVLAAG